MPKVVVPLTEGFEEIEAITIIDILRRGGVEVTVAGLKPGLITGSHSIPVTPDTTIDKINSSGFDMLVLPGGPGHKSLKTDPKVQSLIKEFDSTGKLVGAICAAPTALYTAGILNGKNVTSFPGTEQEMPGVRYSTETVVWDGNIITSRAAGTAGEFSLAIVAKLCGQDIADRLRKGMLY